MEWKKFLKPNKNRIMLFVLLFLSLPLIFEYGCDTIGGKCCITDLLTGLGLLSSFVLISRYIYGILTSLIISYFLSVTVLYFISTKQNIIDFIKPTKKKLILTLLIFLITPIWNLALAPVYLSSIKIEPCPTHLVLFSPEYPYNIGIIILGEIIITKNYEVIENLILPLQLFILYLLSCIIIYFYERLEKIKDFLKINLKKVGLVIIFFISFFILWYIWVVSEILLNHPYIQTFLWILIVILWWPIFILHHLFPSLIVGDFVNSVTWYELMLVIFYWYLLSCFIFSIYGKMRKISTKK